MDLVKNIIIGYVVSFWSAPLITWIHELGHAIMGLLVTKGNIYISMGNICLNKRYYKLGRLYFRFHYTAKGLIQLLYSGRVTCENKSIKPLSAIFIALGGPLFTLITLTCSLTYWCYISNKGTILSIALIVITINCLYQFLVTSWPKQYTRGIYKGMYSDGYNIRYWLRQLLSNSE